MNIEDHFVSKIMTKQVFFVNQDDGLKKAKAVMVKNGINHLPVMNRGHLSGIISRTDIQRVEYISDFANGKVPSKSFFEIFDIEEVMTKRVRVIQSDSRISEAAEIFSENNFHAIPVMEGDVLVGIISVKDVIRFYLKYITK